MAPAPGLHARCSREKMVAYPAPCGPRHRAMRVPERRFPMAGTAGIIRLSLSLLSLSLSCFDAPVGLGDALAPEPERRSGSERRESGCEADCRVPPEARQSRRAPDCRATRKLCMIRSPETLRCRGLTV